MTTRTVTLAAVALCLVGVCTCQSIGFGNPGGFGFLGSNGYGDPYNGYYGGNEYNNGYYGNNGYGQNGYYGGGPGGYNGGYYPGYYR